MKKRIICMLLCIVMCLSTVLTFAGCSMGNSGSDAFVIMTESLDGLFNPFFRCPMDAWPSGLRHLPAKEESGKCRSAGSNPVASA